MVIDDFTSYDRKPPAFLDYLRYYGEHFNRKLCEFACRGMDHRDCDKERLEQALKQQGIGLAGAEMHDAVYLANWCKSTLLGSSVPDEKHLLLFLKDVFGSEGKLVFNRWYADMAKLGKPIEWEEML